MQGERALLHRTSQLHILQGAPVRAGIHLLGVEPVQTAPGRLRAVQREVGLHDELIEIGRILGIRRQADAGADLHFALADAEWVRQRLHQLLGDRAGFLW